MGLIEEIEAELTAVDKRCKIGKLIDSLPPADAAEIERIFTDSLYPVETVRKVLQKRGLQAGSTAFHKHARRECVCQSKKN